MLDLTPLKRIPIIDVAKRLGISVRGAKAMCFMGHDKASPSLSFLKSRNTWRCFGACGKHGDAISLVMEKEKIGFKSALEWFANHFGVDVRLAGSDRQGTLPAKSKNATPAAQVIPQKNIEFGADGELYAWLINHCPAVSSPRGIEYLAGHGITPVSAKRFNLREIRDSKSVFTSLMEKWGSQRVYRSGIAWGKDEKPERLIWSSPTLIFPFIKNGAVIYLQSRMFAGDRKYLNPRGIAKPLFNSDCLSSLPAEGLIYICEGVPDALALETRGLTAVGVLGATSFRPDWVDQFLKFNTVLLCHGDAAGEKFAETISNLFLTRGKSVRCIMLPKGKDAADILAGDENFALWKQISLGDYGQTGCFNHQAIA